MTEPKRYQVVTLITPDKTRLATMAVCIFTLPQRPTVDMLLRCRTILREACKEISYAEVDGGHQLTIVSGWYTGSKSAPAIAKALIATVSVVTGLEFEESDPSTLPANWSALIRRQARAQRIKLRAWTRYFRQQWRWRRRNYHR